MHFGERHNDLVSWGRIAGSAGAGRAVNFLFSYTGVLQLWHHRRRPKEGSQMMEQKHPTNEITFPVLVRLASTAPTPGMSGLLLLLQTYPGGRGGHTASESHTAEMQSRSQVATMISDSWWMYSLESPAGRGGEELSPWGRIALRRQAAVTFNNYALVFLGRQRASVNRRCEAARHRLNCADSYCCTCSAKGFGVWNSNSVSCDRGWRLEELISGLWDVPFLALLYMAV